MEIGEKDCKHTQNLQVDFMLRHNLSQTFYTISNIQNSKQRIIYGNLRFTKKSKKFGG